MALADLVVDAEALRSCSWSAAISGASYPTCQDYESALSEAAKREDESHSYPFWLLAAACSMFLRRDTPAEPLGRMIVTNVSSSPGIEDFSEGQLDAFVEIFPEINDPELKARLGDIIWLRRKDAAIGTVAVDGYLQSAIRLFSVSQNEMTAIDRLRRALDLSASLGKNRDKFDQVVRAIQDLVFSNQPEPETIVLLELGNLLYNHRVGDANSCASLAKTRATKCEGSHQWFDARVLWQLAEKWYRRAANDEKARTAKKHQAKSYEKEADELLGLGTGHALSAASHLQSAIQVLQQLVGTSKARQRLHKKMLVVQGQSVRELGRTEIPVDLTETAHQAMFAVRGHPMDEALFILAMLGHPPSPTQLRTVVVDRAKDHPLMSLLSSVRIDSLGKVVARKPGAFTTDGTEQEAGIKAAMIDHLVLWHRLHAMGVIEPARQQMLLENDISLADLMPIVVDNVWVPPDHAYTIARGLWFGFHGEFDAATHLLIPQVENSVRHIMRQLGHSTSGLSSVGIQNELDLNSTLYNEVAPQIFGADFLFDLKAFLTEHVGENFRNLLAHGLVPDSGFLSAHAVYAWWLSLRLCAMFKAGLLPPLAEDAYNDAEAQRN